MILTHEDLSAIERSLGPEKAAPIINALEKIEQEQTAEVKKALLVELATKSDVAALKTDIVRLEGKLDKLEAELKVLLKVLIGLVIIAISFFSPVGTEIVKLIK